MAKRRALIVSCSLLALGLLIIGILLVRRSKSQSEGRTAQSRARQIGTEPGRTDPARALDPPPLPDSFERPGLISQRLGPMRVYLSIQPELPLRDKDGRALERVPILVVLENDTYEKQSWPPQKLNPDESLFSLSVTRVASQTSKPAFTHSQPASEQKPWEPAERRSFTIPWYTRGLSVGETYIINLRMHGGGAIELRARIT